MIDMYVEPKAQASKHRPGRNFEREVRELERENETLRRENGELKTDIERLKVDHEAELEQFRDELFSILEEKKKKRQPSAAMGLDPLPPLEEYSEIQRKYDELMEENPPPEPLIEEIKKLLAVNEELRAKNNELEQIVADTSDVMTVVYANAEIIERAGFPAAETLAQMFDWFKALADPQRQVMAYQQLALNFGIPTQQQRPTMQPLAPPPQPTYQPEPAPQPAPQPQQPVTLTAIQEIVAAMMAPVLKENRRLQVSAARRAGSSMRTAVAPDAGLVQAERERQYAPKKSDTPRQSIEKALAAHRMNGSEARVN